MEAVEETRACLQGSVRNKYLETMEQKKISELSCIQKRLLTYASSSTISACTPRMIRPLAQPERP